MAFEPAAVVVASAARTSNSSSTTLSSGTSKNVNLWLTTTAKTGTSPTLDVKVEWSMDGQTWLNEASADTFTQKTTGTSLTDNEFKSFTAKAPFYRLTWTIGGSNTPGWTFAVSSWLGG